jgi:hypothetical protein
MALPVGGREVHLLQTTCTAMAASRSCAATSVATPSKPKLAAVVAVLISLRVRRSPRGSLTSTDAGFVVRRRASSVASVAVTTAVICHMIEGPP